MNPTISNRRSNMQQFAGAYDLRHGPDPFREILFAQMRY
jgi:hypothetical protein